MSLNKSLAQFKTDLAGAASRNVRPGSTPPARTTTPIPFTATAEKRTHDTAFKPHDTAFKPHATSNKAGHELATVVLSAVGRLKEKSPATIPFDDLLQYLSLPIDSQTTEKKTLMKKALRAHARVEYTVPQASSKGGFRYRPLHPVTNAEELRTYLATIATAGGVSVKELKDGWSDCTDAVNDLERKGNILVVRWAKDNTPKTIYPDTPTLHVELPAPGKGRDDVVVGKPDEIFVDFWNKHKPPGNDIELRQDLEKAGLTPSSVVKEVKKVDGRKKNQKRASRRGGKVTNHHMLDVLKDFGQRGAT